MVALLGSVSSRECLGAPVILPTTRGLRAHGDTHGWRMSLSAKKQQKSTTKCPDKVKGTLKLIICHCCFYLTHIFEVSRFEVPISRFFWDFFFQTSRFAYDGGWKVCFLCNFPPTPTYPLVKKGH